jgi:xanthine dehydrogenase FAD-binding subunit
MSDFFSPVSLAEALALRQTHPHARMIAGGTDLLVRLRHEAPADPVPLISLERVSELQGVQELGEENTRLSIGAGTTFAQMLASPLLAEHAAILLAAAHSVGGPAIRNMATLGGNLCTASPAGDSLPPLYALGASVEVVSQAGCRRMAVQQFITAPGKTLLGPHEILSRVLLPRRPPFLWQQFEKVGRRQSLAIAVVSFAGLLRLDEELRVSEAHFAWGSVAPTVLMLPALENLLRGQVLDKALTQQAIDLVRSAVQPIDDLRASASYRRILAGNLLRRFLEKLPFGASAQVLHG